MKVHWREREITAGLSPAMKVWVSVAVRERGGENDCTLFNSSLTLSLTWFVNEDNDNSYEDYWTKGKLIGNYKIH